MTIIKSNDGIYDVITQTLEKCNKPQTVSDLMAVPSIYTAALQRWGNDKVRAGEKLSDTLGFMWRRGVLDRFPAPPSRSMARYAYALVNRFTTDGELQKIEAPATKNRGDMTVVEKDGEVVIELKDFTIVIKPK